MHVIILLLYWVIAQAEHNDYNHIAKMELSLMQMAQEIQSLKQENQSMKQEIQSLKEKERKREVMEQCKYLNIYIALHQVSET